MTEVLQKHVEFCKKHDIMFLLEWRIVLSTATSPSMMAEYIRTYYEHVMKEVMGSGDSKIEMIEYTGRSTDLSVSSIT